MPANHSLTFEDIISPLSSSEFLADYWEQKHLHISRKDPSFYGPMMKIEDMDKWFYLAKKSRSRVGIVSPPGNNTPGGYTTTSPAEAAMPDLYKAFNAGCSIALVDVQDYWLPLLPLTQALSEALSARISVNVYFTPAGKQGVHIHPDVTDVFVLQMDGAKDWFMFEPGYMLPSQKIQHWQQLSQPYWDAIAGFEKKTPEDLPQLDHFTVEQGDFLYIPRGLPHCARAPESSPSLHLTVCIHNLCWVDFVKAAVETVSADHIDLRRGLEAGYLHDPQARARMKEAFDSVLKVLTQEISFDRTFDVVAEHEMGQLQLPPDGHFRNLVDLPRLSLDSVVARRRGLEVTLRQIDGACLLDFGANRFKGPARVADALRFVAENRQFRIKDLEGLPDDKSRMVLVRRLIRDGFLTIVDLGDATAL